MATRTSKSNLIRLEKNNNNKFANAAHFLVGFFAVTAELRREIVQFHASSRTLTNDDEYLLLFLNLNIVLWTSTPGEFAYIWQSERLEITVWSFKEREVPFIRRFHHRRRRLC